MKKIFIAGMIGLLFVSLVGCVDSSQKDIEKNIEKVIKDNVSYLAEEKVEKYMDTLLLSDEDYEFTRQQAEQLFENVDLTSTIDSFSIIVLTSDTAKVEVTQTTKAKKVKEGYDFVDTETNSIHTLKLDDGHWKITHTEIIKVISFE